MSSRRRAAPPPELPGYTFVELIGSGGFADVYLFEQHMPRRRVAIKVLHTDRMSRSALAEFAAEANVMAMLSTHPSIVTVYGVGQAPDGRPYLVMEYAPRPTLQARYRTRPLSVAETLRVGIMIAAAVETVHRAGVMHRDIKPANVLFTEYDHPALTDFGIASTSALETAAGVSIPWSAPEMFADQPFGGPEADVYALAATLYTVLAGHSPFEAERAANSLELIDRIERMPAQGVPRPDVPDSLQRTLLRALSKSPADRHSTALAFARALQKVQIELSMAVTVIDIIDDSPGRQNEDAEADGLTRVRSVMSITPLAAAAALTPADPVVDSAAVPAPRAAVDVEPRQLRRRTRSAAPSLWSKPWGRVTIITSAVALVAAVFAASILTTSVRAPDATPSSAPQNIVVAAVPAPQNVAGRVEGDAVVFTWTNPDALPDDRYLWNLVSAGRDEEAEIVDLPTVTVPRGNAVQVCIAVSILRDNGAASTEPARLCAP
ncbi:serine/threonine-protein kinase [Microbacterium sp. ZW T5_56]|uniref:serine/threonine-protein kinase n=1 Tax=Microbacterium sp. ZW T5_56 TaxID=3378081 RepID=UPI0038536EBB